MFRPSLPHFTEKRDATKSCKVLRLTRQTAGCVLLTTLCAFVAVSAIIYDFTPTHLYNPTWPPHARFHAYLSVARTVLIMATIVALVWGPVRAGQRFAWGLLAFLLLGWLAIWFLAPLAVPGMVDRIDLWFAAVLTPTSGLGLWLVRQPSSR